MALNKRKVLEVARKHAQKGAKAKALKEYDKLLALEPRDAKLLLEIGDAYRRWGQAEEAIAQYGKVAQQYRQDGFDARAVAVFKQILNLDPKHYSAYVSISELYQRMGLDAEAITALQTAADGYHKEGRKAEALDLLRQTAALDPTNTTSRLKVADLLRQEGMKSEALSEYKAVAEELASKQHREQLIVIQERILELNSNDVETLNSLVRNLISSGDLVRAEKFAVCALKASAEPAQYELLIEIYTASGDQGKIADTTRAMAKLYRDRGDEEKARELTQRLPVENSDSGSRLAADVSEIDEPDLGDDQLLDDEPFLSTEGDEDFASDLADDDISLDLDLESEAPKPAASDKSAAAAEPAVSAKSDALPDGDPDQLLAEANVYLRYDKREQAIASLLGILSQDANHCGALEKLGETYAADGQTAEAVDVWRRAAAQFHRVGNEEALMALKERIATLDPAAAEQIEFLDPAAPEVPEISLDLDNEIDLVPDTAAETIEASDGPSDADFASGGDDFEIEIEDPDDAGDAGDVLFDVDMEEEGADEGLTEPADSIVVDEEEASGIEFDTDDVTTPEAASSAPEDSTTDAKIDEELEEVEFYISQEMFEEAEGILSRILKAVPNHAAALLRMGEVAAARGLASEAAAAETPAKADGAPASDADESATDSSDNAEPEATPEAADPGASFDLREALADVLADDEESVDGNETSGVLSTVEDGFGSIFSDFKKGVDATLEEGDFETRYDLGIAYSEMGLYEDAIAEFRVCLDSSDRRFDSLYLMGICTRELSRFDDAVNHFEQALAMSDVPQERTAGVYFDLSIAQQGLGDIERARASVQKTLELDPDFPKAKERLHALEEGGVALAEVGQPSDGFETFEDLFTDDDDDVDGDAAMVEEIPEENLESFDDLISEAEAVEEPEAAASDLKAETSRGSSRKKISFV